MPGVLLRCLVHQAHRGAPGAGSYSVDWSLRHLKEHLGGVLPCSSARQAFEGPASPLFLYRCWPVPTREAMVMSPPATAGFSSIALLPWCLAFFHRHFPPRSPPSHPLDPSLHSQQPPSPWDCSMIPKLQLPAAAPSRGTASLFRVCMAAARTVGFSLI